MKIRFKKAHVAGIPEGAIREVNESFGQRMINEGHAEEHIEAPAGPSDTTEVVPPVPPAEVTAPVIVPPVEVPAQPAATEVVPPVPPVTGATMTTEVKKNKSKTEKKAK